ncbi:uncharacterized protein LOC125239836 [Leguminivora glycinivorella]|uniref:uncharacterized protein LOC125239836 n=1 Tax=Leguminivora glycinivorella TaxID=1035111 RepID=UPI00201022AB|nr:uncharacterized protein LOC125239836 [Leguminivora glycinivorella]
MLTLILRSLVIFLAISSATASLQTLFPAEDQEYQYSLKSNVSSGPLTPQECSFWTLEARLLVTVYDNFTRVRYKLEGLKTSVYSKNQGYSSYQSAEAARLLGQPWEVDYLNNGIISSVYVSQEPVWSHNMKRALALNFQLSNDSYKEPCLYETCVAVYINQGRTIRKYTNSQLLGASAERSWSSVNVVGNPEYDDLVGVPDAIATAERVYEFNEAGLESLDMRGTSEYKVQEHILSVASELSLNFISKQKRQQIDKLNVTRTNVQYVSQGFSDPSAGINNLTQDDLRNKAYKILLKIARKGIDANNIVRNATLIHSLDFIDLLNTMTQLNFASLSKLFDDMVLGTSYDVETSRNIFLEVLPQVRTHACALLVKYLVTEQKEKIEDATILSLVRKLPFNVANYSSSLLEDLEVFTKLGLDFSRDIRHAAILSFATLAHKTRKALQQEKQDLFDNIAVKYFRMYSDCPQYIDRMVWLQGLCNLGYSADSYTRTVYMAKKGDRHERLWAALADGSSRPPPAYGYGRNVNDYSVLQSSLPIIMDETEHIQLRIAALHALLRSDIRASDFIYVHNYIKNSGNNQLKRFWYSTVKSLEKCKLYNEYKAASYYVPFVASQVSNPDSTYWATNNYIVSTKDDEVAAALQFMSVGEPTNALPAFAAVKLSTGGRRPHHVAVYVIAEGVTANMFKKIHTINEKELKIEKLVEVLRSFKVPSTPPEQVHIDIVIKIHDKTVYASHVNQSRFDSWNGEEITKSIEDFLRFGSHINQQIVYYPFQMDVSIPTELGTPIRLQSTIISFTSIRGNLTAPSSQDLTWRNDLHIRYQATAVSAIRTHGPLLASEHEALIQRSLVAHFPIRCDVTLSPLNKSFQLRWPNPGGQYGGVAMHSRLQVILTSKNGRDAYTVTERNDDQQVDETGVFFDCERPTTVAEIMEKLFATKANSFDVLATLQPSLILLNALVLITTPPSGSCGALLPPRPLRPGPSVLELGLQLQQLEIDFEDRVKIKMQHDVEFKEDKSDGEVYLKVGGYTQMESVGNNLTLDFLVAVRQPSEDNARNWKVCIHLHDISHVTPDQDLSSIPAAYEGHMSMTFNNDVTLTCPAGSGGHLRMDYEGRPVVQSGRLERHLKLTVFGDQLPKLSASDLGTQTGQILGSLHQQPLNLTAAVTEKNGLAFVKLNNGAEMQFPSQNFAWMLDSWSNMQVMKKLGIYRECRLEESIVGTLSGGKDPLPSASCYEILVLADCTSAPRYAIFHQRHNTVDIYRLYTGGNFVTVRSSGGDITVTINGDTPCEQDCRYPPQEPFYDFKVTRHGDTVKIFSRLSGVQLHYKYSETVVLVPSLALYTSCGVCSGQRYYTQC